MKVPKEILKVERPPNTIVYAFGHDPVKYNVKRREYQKIDGRTVQKDGETIGAIIDGAYVPIANEPIRYSESDIRFWGPSKLITNLSKDILDDLLQIYHPTDAMKTYIMAVLRTIDKGLKDYEIKSAYDNDYISITYPGISLSKDTVSDHLYDLGRTFTRITKFMELRASKVLENHLVAVDGMLKSYESDTDIFSDFSRKALKKDTRDASILFAYDTESMEPICSKVYSGNQTDVSVFKDFLDSCKISKGIIVADKGFSYEPAKLVFLDNPGLRFLIPLKNDAKVISEYKMLSFDSSLANRFGIECRKIRMIGGKYLYSFRDPAIAAIEEQSWIEKQGNYDPSVLRESRNLFGTIVFMSDLDAPSEAIYAAYEERWELEVLFRFYKHILDLDETRVESEQSVIGTEFVNFLSVIMMCRLRKAFLNNRTICKRPFKSNMKLLRKGVMIRQTPNGVWLPKKITSVEEKVFIELGILKSPEREIKKRGRPKGSKNRQK